jgi:hypothetical protein
MAVATRTTDFPEGPRTNMCDQVPAELDERLFTAIQKVSGMDPASAPSRR